MKPTFINALWIALCLGTGALVYQYAQQTPDYAVAVERSYFQLIALLAAWFFWRERSEQR